MFFYIRKFIVFYVFLYINTTVCTVPRNLRTDDLNAPLCMNFPICFYIKYFQV